MNNESNPLSCGVLFAVTSSVTAKAFLPGQLSRVSSITSTALVVGDDIPENLVTSECVTGFSVGLSRRPSPIKDLAGLCRIYSLLGKVLPGVVIFGTPKMGLLMAVASWVRRVPVRIFIVHGLRWEGARGWRRLCLQWADRVACLSATKIVAVSPSVQRCLTSTMRIPADKVVVLRSGSANGIDGTRFSPPSTAHRDRIRDEFEIQNEEIVFCFVARLTHDKGIQDLPKVWARIHTDIAGAGRKARLLVVGQPEPGSAADQEAIDALRGTTSVTILPHLNHVEKLLQVSDVNLSLSKREGMPTVILEAAACAVPTVAFYATGVNDAIREDTGLLVESGAFEAYSRAAAGLALDDERRAKLGARARDRVLKEFRPEELWDAWVHLLMDESMARHP